MLVSKDTHQKLVDHLLGIQRANRIKMMQNKSAMRRLVEEQTILKRANAGIGEMLRNLKPREPKKPD